jgi:uncharacterized protein YprB with RNaseH-like and TPR domain
MAIVPPLRRLFFDIETSPNVGFFWRPGHRISLSHENIIHERQIITVAWKWQGQKTVHHLAWDKDQNDKTLVTRFLKQMERADEIVAHFGDGFDIPWMRARALINGFRTLPVYKTVDTCAWAARLFQFNCNKLDYLAQIAGFGRKLPTDYRLWVDVVLGKNSSALARMIRYNRHDVVLLEKVYHWLSGIGPVKTHAGVLNGHEKWSCPRCASDQVQKVRRYITAKGTEQQQMKCVPCGGYFNISATTREQYEEARSAKA